MKHNRRKCKDVYDRTPNLFTKQEWDRLLSVSCNVAKSKAPESLGVLNQNIGQYLSTTGQYEMPVVRAISCLAPKDIVALYHIDRCNVEGCIPHFYTEDKKFESTWTFPRKSLSKIARYPMVISPDFSVYENLAFPQKFWNIFRNKFLAAWWQYNGLNVIPNVSWMHGQDYAMSFDGWPKHSVIAVNSTGINDDEKCKIMWLEGYKVMLETLEPAHILRYGAKIEGENEAISTYYDNDNKKFAKYGW